MVMGWIAKVIRDKRVLRLIGKYLRRGAMVGGLVEASVEGTPQGGPLSPLLANIYLMRWIRSWRGAGTRFYGRLGREVYKPLSPTPCCGATASCFQRILRDVPHVRRCGRVAGVRVTRPDLLA